MRRPHTTLFPYTTLFRSNLVRGEQITLGLNDDWDHDRSFLGYLGHDRDWSVAEFDRERDQLSWLEHLPVRQVSGKHRCRWRRSRSEEHTSELQSLRHLVC